MSERRNYEEFFSINIEIGGETRILTPEMTTIYTHQDPLDRGADHIFLATSNNSGVYIWRGYIDLFYGDGAFDDLSNTLIAHDTAHIIADEVSEFDQQYYDAYMEAVSANVPDTIGEQEELLQTYAHMRLNDEIPLE